MQELQTTRQLLMRCWARVRVLEQEQAGSFRRVMDTAET